MKNKLLVIIGIAATLLIVPGGIIIIAGLMGARALSKQTNDA